MIYLDIEGKLILIEDIGIFELKEDSIVTKTGKKNLFKKQKTNKSFNNNFILDKKSRLAQELFFEKIKTPFYDDSMFGIEFFGDMSNFKLSRLFEIISVIKTMPSKKGIFAKLSSIIEELIIEKEGSLLVLSSKNKNLINLFVEKITLLGFFPINQINLPQGTDILYKFYYEDDSDEEFY